MRYRVTIAILHRLWGTWIAYAFFCGVPTVCFFIALKAGDDLTRRGIYGLPLWMLFSLGYVYMFVFMPLLYAFQLWMGSRRNKTLLGLQHCSFSPAGFSTGNKTFVADFKWVAVIKALETKHFFLFFISPRAAHFVPKAYLRDKDERARFRNLIRTYLGAKAKIFA